MFVTWKSFTCEVSGSTFRKHRCERCRAVYGYEMRRTVRESSSALYGIGQDAARERAEANAKRTLEDELANDFEFIPCPNCGWYQSQMVSAARDERCRWLAQARTFCLGLSVVCVFFAIGIPNEARANGQKSDETAVLVALAGAGVSLALFVVFFLIHRARRRRLDPNRTPVEKRIAKAIVRGAIVVAPNTEPWKRDTF